jgi:hypothetical protein
MLAMAQRETPSTPRRLSASDLMAARCDIGLPLLENIGAEQRFLADDREAIALAEILARSGIAIAEDRDATKYLQLTLQRWVGIHGGDAIDRRFDLDVTLSDRLVDYSEEHAPEGKLYLIVDPESAAFVLFKPTIEMLEQAHPLLPSTFFHHFVGALNRWVRVYDYRDADERVEMLRQWYEGEENGNQYELPDVERCTPRGLKERPLSVRGLKTLRETIADQQVNVLIESLLGLCLISQKTKRPEFTEDMGEQLMDSNPPLPCLLAAFSQADAVVGCFDDEGQTAMEVTPQPNLIIPLKFSDPASVSQGFRTLAVACETLAAASRLIDLMPGNDDGIIAREGVNP